MFLNGSSEKVFFFFKVLKLWVAVECEDVCEFWYASHSHTVIKVPRGLIGKCVM